MRQYLFCGIAILLLLPNDGDAARILGLFPYPGKSHFISFAPLLEELANRGHEMTVVTAYPRKMPLKNYKEIVIEDYFHEQNRMHNMFENQDINLVLMLFWIRSMAAEYCEYFLNEPGIQTLIQSTDVQYDLIIYEPFITECTYGIVHQFKAPFIQISSNVISKWMGEGVGNPFFYSYIPDLMLGYTDHMTFTERLTNTISQTIFDLERSLITLPRMEAIMRKYFTDPNVPSIKEIETNSSFLLLNSHIALNYPRPLTPNTAEVGGMHLRDPQKLPKDIQRLLDEAKDGAIYFSLGTNVKSTDMPDEIRQSFISAFSKLKQKVLWKWETDTLPGQPKNVHLSKWFPQSDILAHPNVKAFITHGGLLSTQEATYFGKPLIAIPIMADQKQNSLKVATQGFAIVLDVRNVTEKALDWAFHEVLTDNRYSENAAYLSKVFRDQPEKPLDRAVFWTEYVIRHKGAPHMRSAALKLNFFQYYLLDIIAVIVLALSAWLALSVAIIRMFIRHVFSKTKVKNSDVMKKKKI